MLLCLLLLTHLDVFGLITLAVDDTLCHKRGKNVAFGGIFLDPVLSTRSRKILRFGLNYIVVAMVVRLPFRPDRYFALPILWRVFRKKGEDGHCERTASWPQLVRHLAVAIPCRSLCLVADKAYINATVLADLPDNVMVIGPLSKKAALYLPAMPKVQGQKGRSPEERAPPADAVAATGEAAAARGDGERTRRRLRADESSQRRTGGRRGNRSLRCRRSTRCCGSRRSVGCCGITRASNGHGNDDPRPARGDGGEVARRGIGQQQGGHHRRRDDRRVRQKVERGSGIPRQQADSLGWKTRRCGRR